MEADNKDDGVRRKDRPATFGRSEKNRIDHALINALIERWKPETNIFHFVSGETTITLEDISYLYGLPIDGKAVTGKVWSEKHKLS